MRFPFRSCILAALYIAALTAQGEPAAELPFRYERNLIWIKVNVAGRAEPHEALPHATEWLLMAVSVALAASGIFLAWKWYAKEEGRAPARIAAAFPAVYGLVAEAFRGDRLYDVLFVRPFEWTARTLWKVVDVLIIDGILNAGAFMVELAGDFLRFLQTGNVRNYALTFFLGVVGLLLLVIGVSF